MFRKLMLAFSFVLFVNAFAFAEMPASGGQPSARRHAKHQTLAESVFGRKAAASPRPVRRTDGLPTGRAYFGNRYYGNFNNRFFGPQYGYF